MAKNYVSYENAQVLVQGINDKIDSKFSELGGAYIARGSRAFADLPETLTESMVGYVYNITDDFETDSRFIDGLEKKYSAGTNVVVVDAGTDGNHDYKLDVLGNFVDVDAIETRIDGLDGEIRAVDDSIYQTRHAITDEVFSSSKAYNKGDVVWYFSLGDPLLYRCKQTYDPNTYVPQNSFLADCFEPVTVEQLISSAEPDSLTQEQMNSLLAIL